MSWTDTKIYKGNKKVGLDGVPIKALTITQFKVFMCFLRYYYRYKRAPGMQRLADRFEVRIGAIQRVYEGLVKKGYLIHLPEERYYYPSQQGIYKLLKDQNIYKDIEYDKSVMNTKKDKN